MRSLPLSDPLFVVIRNFLEEHLGLHYDDNQRELMADKVAARAQDQGFESLLDYYYLLRYDPAGPAELEELAEHLVVRETYFFREIEPLQMLCRDVLAPLCARTGRARVWCAACATGEEPLTLAMLLAARGLGDRVEIVASDISRRGLDRARSGEFGPRAVRTEQLPAEGRPWLTRTPEGGWRVPRELVERISWRRLNLLDAQGTQALGRFDAILCRNVLIYFRDGTARGVIQRLTDALVPGGVLLVGVSESLLRFGATLQCEERGGAFLYRKAE